MTFLGSNLKLLRAQRGRTYTQDVVANALDIKRGSLSGYENGDAEPPLEVLTRMAAYYSVSIDRLLRQDMAKLMPSRLREVVAGIDVRVMTDAMQL